ncbi:PREDICTED: uncharacterized protein LOC109335433 [Lupinus angustifolius]|uniref:uncharacterized protein LOC109335433 n=1 Tax=Lupinus angustifolius TaxID=3871 RepID=UPI00092E807C|nr:PREDICTED: uncharacterized protein LOC109335433 [Lupinus angustifolius]
MPQDKQIVPKKQTPLGMTSMKSDIQARSKDVKIKVQWNSKGQLLNLKDENSLVSYIEVVVRQNMPLTFSKWIDVRLNVVKEHIWNEIAKSRQRWIGDGDSNSKFFHLSINKNQKFKKFTGLSIEGEWIEDPTRVKNYISSFFEAKFEECTGCRPSLDGIGFNRLAAEENAFLTTKFEVEEIKGAIWSCDGDKSPSPDGFNFSFLKKFWECLKDDFIRMVEDFYSFGNLPRGCNASFIVLIPKNNSSQSLGEYRPISLIGCIHKIISKLLAARLKKVIHLIISDCQSAFIKGRFIMDGVVVANEVIDQARKKKKRRLLHFQSGF